MDRRPLPPVAREAATLKVLDVGSLVAGPFCAALLGDLGAEVIKVEPLAGDRIRRIGHGEPGYSFHWQVHGRNKRSITLNLELPRGHKVFRELAKWADVLVENLRPGKMAKLGLSYEDLRRVNPRLVYVSVSGWGQTGPYRERPSLEFAAAAFGGLTKLTGFADRPPVLPGLAIMDHTTAMFAAIGALEAVRRRDAAGPDGTGTQVDVALYEPAIRMANETIIMQAVTGRGYEREGSIPSGQKETHVPYGYVYETADGRYIAAYASTPRQIVGLLRLLDVDQATVSEAETRRAGDVAIEVDPKLRAWIRERTLSEVQEALTVADVPFAAVNGAAEILADEHVAARGNIVTIENAWGETVSMQAPLPRLGDGVPGVRWPAQDLGASNRAVFQGLLGFSDQVLDELVGQGVIGPCPSE